jgi:hypothetical protein
MTNLDVLPGTVVLRQNDNLKGQLPDLLENGGVEMNTVIVVAR